MTPTEFYNTYIVFARKSELETKVPALFTIAQAAHETGWHVPPGFNFFGIKDTAGHGNLLLTTEYNKKTGWRKIKDWFKSYKTPADSFTAHGLFLRKNKRYANAFIFSDPFLFAQQIAKAGYATDPQYYEKLAEKMNLLKRQQ